MIIRNPPPVDFAKDQIICLSDGASRESALAQVIQHRLDRQGCPEKSRRILADEFTVERPNVRNPLPKAEQYRVAAEKIQEAVRNKRRVVLFGDYDCDGVTSLALVHDSLLAAGLPERKLNCFIPRRQEHGYGLTMASLASCMRKFRPELLIALDCGTNSRQEVDRLNQEGIDSIVVDHHTPGKSLPETVLFNPKAWPSLPDQFWDLQLLSAAGLSFLLVQALADELHLQSWDESRALLLAGLGTYVDQVPLLGINRTLVKQSLHLAQSGKLQLVPGLDFLERIRQSNEYAKGPLTERTYGFFLGPCLNAPGRLGDAKEALRLLLAKEPSKAQRLAQRCFEKNKRRQEIQKPITKRAIKLAEGQGQTPVIFLAGENWHPGVVGIVASDVKEVVNRPVIVCSGQEDEQGKVVWKGSGRSIEEYNLGEKIQEAMDRKFIERGGGHPMAAGLSFREDQRDPLQNFLATTSGLDGQKFAAKREIVAYANCFKEKVWHGIYRALEPFGSGHPEPSLIMRNAVLLAEPEPLPKRELGRPDGEERPNAGEPTTIDPSWLGKDVWGVVGTFLVNDESVRIQCTDLTQAKDWKVGQAYDLDLKLTGWRDYRGETRFGFRVKKPGDHLNRLEVWSGGDGGDAD